MARCAPPTGSSSRAMMRRGRPRAHPDCRHRCDAHLFACRRRGAGAGHRTGRKSGRCAYPLDLLDIGPGQRVELVVRMPDEEGAEVKLGNLRGSNPFTVAALRATGTSLKRDIRDVKRCLPIRSPKPICRRRRAFRSNLPQPPNMRRSQHLRHDRLYVLGHQQGTVAGRHARSRRSGFRAETGQKLCAAGAQPYPACASDPSAWLELRILSSNKRTILPPPPIRSCFCRTSRPNSVSSPTIPATGCSIAISSSTRRPECRHISGSFELFSLWHRA